MAMSRRTRIGVVIAGILGPIALAGALAPHVVDVERYKPAMIAAVKAATGRELVIEGPMRLSLLPRPHISARQVRFSNAVGAKGAQMVDVRWIGISPSWWALLRGDIEVGRLTLYRPTIVLEADAEGRPNWEFSPGAGAVQPAGAPSSGLHLAVGRLRIVQGMLEYTDPRTRRTFKAEQIDATAAVGSFEGPIAFAGAATVNGVPLSLDFELGGPAEGGHDTKLNLKVQSGTLAFDGRVSKLAADAEVAGKLSVATGLLTDFIGAVVRATGGEQPKFDGAVVGQFLFDGGVEASPTRLALNDFKMSMAGETAAGNLALTFGKALSLTGHVALPKVDLAQWLKVLETPATFLPKPPPVASTAKPPTAKAPAQAAEPASLSPLPREMMVAVSVDIAEMPYAGGTIRDFAMALDIRNGAIALPKVHAVLPGGMTLQATSAIVGDPAKPVANGEISLSGNRLRETLKWLQVDTEGVPAGRLQSIEARGKMMSAAGKLQVSDVAFVLDDVKGTGAGTLTFTAPLTATAEVKLERFDLDAYMPKVPEAAVPAALEALSVTPTATARTEAVATTAGAPLPVPPSFGLKAKVAALVYRGEPAKGVEMDVTLQGNMLKLNDVKVADLLGARLGIKGTIADFGTLPRFDLTYNATVPDTEKMLAYAGLPRFINGRIGAATASGRLSGTRSAVTLGNTAVGMLGATVRGNGSLTLGDTIGFNFPSISLEASDGSRLVSAASGEPLTAIGRLSASGSLKGTPARAAFNGKLEALGSAMQGTIDAVLDKRPTVTASLEVPGILDADRWLNGASAEVAGPSVPATRAPAGNGAAAASSSIDLSPLRAFDATLALTAGRVDLAPFELANAHLSARLKNGVLTVTRLAGNLFGGNVELSGKLDASGSALALDLQGGASGVSVAQLLRETAGDNALGDSDLEVAVDGRIDATGLSLTGRGRSAGEIAQNLSGSAALSGFVQPTVVRGSRSFALFATGFAGMFSDEMAFNRLLLQSFIDRRSPLAGNLRLSGGTVTTQDQIVRGQNATAHVTSRIDLGAGTTETAVAISVGGQSSPQPAFVARLRGPIGAPQLTTSRGGGY